MNRWYFKVILNFTRDWDGNYFINKQQLTCIWQTFFRTSATQNSWSSLHTVVKIFSQTSPKGSKQTLHRFSSKVPSTICFTTPLMSTTAAMVCTTPPEDKKHCKIHYYKIFSRHQYRLKFSDFTTKIKLLMRSQQYRCDSNTDFAAILEFLNAACL